MPRQSLVAALVVSTAVLCLWEAAVLLFGVSSYILPAPHAIVLDIARESLGLTVNALYTLGEAVVGFALGGLVGFALGAAFFFFPGLERGVYPYVVGSQMIPVLAFAPILVVWLGNGPASKIAIAGFLTFFPVTVNTLAGFRSLDPRRVDLFRSYAATPMQELVKLRLVWALPYIFAALKIAATRSVVGVVVGEFVGTRIGLGLVILNASYFELTVRLWSALVYCAATGVAFYWVVVWAERRLLFWEPSVRG